MKTTFKEILAGKLLQACEEATASHRPHPIKEPDKPKPPSVFKDETIEWFWRQNSAVTEVVSRMLAEALNEPRLLKNPSNAKGQNLSQYSPMTVVYVLKNLHSHYYPVKATSIVLNAKTGVCLNRDGKPGNILQHEECRLATVDEVRSCISNLNDAQWAGIIAEPVFAHIVHQTLAIEVEQPTGDDV